MAFDRDRDARRIRRWFLLAALGLAVALAFAAWQGLDRPWQEAQARDGAGREARGILQTRACSGDFERCTTCHPMADDGRPAAGHPPDPGRHRERGVGCTDCHGGTGRALSVEAAHAVPGTGRPDPLMRPPFLVASCGRCHVPGGPAGTEGLAAGARLYRELGCPVCHPLTAGGRGSADYGPDLRALGRRSTAYLRDSVLTPASNFPASTMPSFGRTLGGAPERLRDLLIYLHALTLSSPPACDLRADADRLVRAPCADCHAGSGGRAGGRMRHRCIYLLGLRDTLRCAGCHPDQLPAASARRGHCPVITGYRPACAGCHPPRSVD